MSGRYAAGIFREIPHRDTFAQFTPWTDRKTDCVGRASRNGVSRNDDINVSSHPAGTPKRKPRRSLKKA